MPLSEEEARQIAEETANRLRDLRPLPPEDKPAGEPDKPDLAALVSEGRYDEFTEALAKDQTARLTGLIGPLVAGQAESAKREARRELGSEDFDKWLPAVETLAKEWKVDLNALTTADQWREAFKLAKGKNLERVLEDEREKLRAEFEQNTRSSLPPIAQGSSGEGGKESAAAYSSLEASEKRLVDLLEFDPVAYKRNKEVVRRYREEDGAVTDMPVLDEDIPFAERGTSRVIPPGKF